MLAKEKQKIYQRHIQHKSKMGKKKKSHKKDHKKKKDKLVYVQ
jgi:hypothetical protein